MRLRFGQALAQRNALVARLGSGQGTPSQLDIWDATLAESAAALIAARDEAVAELDHPFTVAAEELGLEGGAEVEYAPRAPGSAEEIRIGLAERREADLRLGRRSWGPHLDEIKFTAATRSLRRYGSQGQQRAALLALIFAERDALLAARQVAPLLLLDDVMSELDPGRRERLVERLGGAGQAVITAAAEDSLPPPRAGQHRADAAGSQTRSPRRDSPPRPPARHQRPARRARDRRPEDGACLAAGGLGRAGRRADRRRRATRFPSVGERRRSIARIPSGRRSWI